MKEQSLQGLTRAQILIEAFPYIEEYENEIVVIKYGGHAMLDKALQQAVMEDLLLMRLLGIRPVLVHGGGKDISQMLEKLQIESSFVDGLRVTSDEAMEVVQMVLCGSVNKDLVAMLDGKGIGLSGLDGNLFLARPKRSKRGRELGRVGDIVEVHPQILIDLLEKGYIPVISSVAKGLEDNLSYNVNADIAASKIASSLHAKKLILLSDVKGLMEDPQDETTMIAEVGVSQVPYYKKAGIITGGMIPKIDCVVEAIRQGVEKATIQDGRVPHSLLMELFTTQGEGTLFKS